MTKSVFDYVIVGAGSAGCVLANKLSENPRNKVLLIEAGASDRKFWIKVPLGYAFTFSDPKVNWCYSAAADPGLNNRKIFWPRGRVLGGSSSINAMAYMRGLPHDFDDWERAGARGWSWNDVERVFDALELNCEITTHGTRQLRGEGPLWVSDLSDKMHPFSQHFLSAGKEMGWPEPTNLNSADSEGLSTLRSNVRNGRRWSSADAFLRPALNRPNLRVVTNAHVERVTLDGTRATGIDYRLESQQHNVSATKEVIVSAGAINSPQLLQLSGIGPADFLKSQGIPVLQELPHVGQGLQDHIAVSHYYRSTEPTLNNKLGNLLGKLKVGLNYILTRGGPLSVPVNQCGGYVRSHANAPVPDVQIYCNPMSYVTTNTGETTVDPKAGFLLCAQPCRPTSRGTVNIVSSNPLDAPNIQPNSLSTTEDREAAIKASRVLQALAHTPTIRSVTKQRLAPDITTMDDDDLLENFRDRASTVFHPTCTCRMGRDAKDSVVDARLRVHGIDKLRIVDASAFPNITSGNTNAPTIMLAAKAAELIFQDDTTS